MPSPDATPLTAADTLATLQAWADQGWLRALDAQLAGFVLQHDPQATPPLLMATALLAHLEGRGHTCLPLATLLHTPQALLAWPDAAHSAWQQWAHNHSVTLADCLAALSRSPLLRHVPATRAPADLFAQADADTGQPLVLAGSHSAPLLYLRRYWQHEQAVLRGVAQRAGHSHPVAPEAVRGWLDTLFGPADAATPDWQRIACALALRAGLTVVTGGPGTGKTYTAARLLALLWATQPQPERLKVALAAPTGKAAARLRQSIDQALADLGPRLAGQLDLSALSQGLGAASTVHALLGAQRHSRAFAHHAQQPLDVDVLIVDETSMIHLELMAALLGALPPHARLVLLGDKDQLASVEAGSVLGDLCAHADTPRYSAATCVYLQHSTGCTLSPSEALGSALDQQTVMLRQSRRFGSTIGAVALAVNAGRARTHAKDGANASAAPGAYDLLLQSPDSAVALWAAPVAPTALARLATHGRSGANACYADYLQAMRQRPQGPMDEAAHSAWAVGVLRAFERFRILCAVHDGPWGDVAINVDVQRALAAEGWLKPEGEWFEGRPVMVTRNNKALGVFNGDVGVALRNPAGDKLRVCFLDGDQLRSVPVSRLAHVDTAFAMTIHKSQGSEFAHTVVVLPDAAGDILTRELVYTGVTRARTELTVVEPRAGLLGQALAQRVLRSSGWGA